MPTGKEPINLEAAAVRRQVHIIYDELAKLGKDYSRLNERISRLTARLRDVIEEAEQLKVANERIVERFRKIKDVTTQKP